MLPSFLLWLLSIFLFVFLIQEQQNNSYQLPIILFWIDVIVGFVAFISFISKFDEYLHKKYSKTKASFLIVSSALIISILGISFIIFSLLLLSKNFNKPKKTLDKNIVSSYKLLNPGITIGMTGDDVRIIQSALKTNPSLYPSGIVSGYFGNATKEAVMNFQKKYSMPQTGYMDVSTTNKFNDIYGNETRSYYLNLAPTPTNIPAQTTQPNVVNTQTNSGQIDCVGPDNKIFKTTMTSCERLNRDWGKGINYMVNCNIHSKCGGGSVWLSKSVCDNTICCTYSNGSSVFLYDKTQCKSNTTYYTYPTYAPYPTSIPWPTYAPPPTFAPWPTATPYVYVTPTTSPDQCKSQVVSYYASLLQSCNQYGGTSVYDGCVRIYSNERDAAYSRCGN